MTIKESRKSIDALLLKSFCSRWKIHRHPAFYCHSMLLFYYTTLLVILILIKTNDFENMDV